MQRGASDHGDPRASGRHGGAVGANAERQFREARDARSLDQFRNSFDEPAARPRRDGAQLMSSAPPPAQAGGFAWQPQQSPQCSPHWFPQWSPQWSALASALALGGYQCFPQTSPQFFPFYGASAFLPFNPYGVQPHVHATLNASFSPLGGAANPLVSGGVGLALGLGLNGLASGVGAFLGSALGGRGFGGFGGFGQGFGRGWCDVSPAYCGWW
ncbi:hypothetical protein PV762_26505 [Mitsuaria sp. CC2]|uniref:hypothetical protein n=1 Tax=Mitsuaria sp. CC2 TaxID=3029186 RepID=UPI003B8DABE6